MTARWRHVLDAADAILAPVAWPPAADEMLRAYQAMSHADRHTPPAPRQSRPISALPLSLPANTRHPSPPIGAPHQAAPASTHDPSLPVSVLLSMPAGAPHYAPLGAHRRAPPLPRHSCATPSDAHTDPGSS
jgi:hypothetical protein